MIVFPAIDIQNGQCVKLYKGDPELATVYSYNPIEQAKFFEAQGASWLHIVDLDGASEGKSINVSIIERILNRVEIPVQLGGGIRTNQHIEHWLRLGVSRVILGTTAAQKPLWVKHVAELHPGKIAVSLDTRRGLLATSGGRTETNRMVQTQLEEYRDSKVAAIIYNNFDVDGTKEGPDIAGAKALTRHTNIPLIVSGGFSSISELEQVKELSGKGIMGAIVRTAFYDGSIDPARAFALQK